MTFTQRAREEIGGGWCMAREYIGGLAREITTRVTDIVVGLPPVHEASDAEWQLTDADNDQIEREERARE